MKKEIFAGCLLIFMFSAAILNIAYANHISSSIIAQIDQAESLGVSGQFDEAAEQLDSALKAWDDNKVYTGIFLRHPEIDSAYDCFYDVQAALFDRNSDTLPALCSKLRYHIECMANMEKLKLSSILTCPEVTWIVLP